MRSKERRKQTVIDPQLQFGLMLFSLLAAGIAVLIHGVLVTRNMTRLAREAATGEELLSAIPGIVVTDTLLTLLILAPIVLLLGRSLTLRVAGPIYRFRVYLADVIRGEETGDCRIRADDLFQDVSELITQATATHRAGVQAERADAASTDAPDESQSAA